MDLSDDDIGFNDDLVKIDIHENVTEYNDYHVENRENYILINDNTTVDICNLDHVEISFIPNKKDGYVSLSNASIIQKLITSMEDLVVIHIFTYLDCRDVISLSSTCKIMLTLTQSPLIWNSLYRKDFIFNEEVNCQSIEYYNKSIEYTKSNYVTSFYCSQNLIDTYKKDIIASKELRKYEIKRSYLEFFLDYAQVRIMIPFFYITIVLTMILIAQKIDGLDIPYWGCFLLLFIYTNYLIISILLSRQIFKNQSNNKNIYFGLWQNFKTPISFIYSDSIFCYLITTMFLIDIQIILLVLKLSMINISWIYVFIPIWIIFIIFFILPCSSKPIIHDFGIWFVIFTVIWIPLVIFFICITIKLIGEDNNTNDSKIRILFILIPFWFIEGIFLLLSFLTYITIFLRYIQGFVTTNEIYQHSVFIILSWSLLLPILCSQILLSIRDEYLYGSLHSSDTNIIKATHIVLPLVILLSIIGLIHALFGCLRQTSFQQARLVNYSYSIDLKPRYHF